MRLPILFVLLAACRSGTTPTPAGPSCADVMPRLTEAAPLGVKEGGADDETVAAHRADAKRFEPRLIQACVDDGWSVELRTCIRDKPLLELDACEDLATPAQVESVVRLRDAFHAEREAESQGAPTSDE